MRQITLIGCVKTKNPGPMKAKDLYSSPLFKARREYAESRGVPWFILSARLGLVDPELVIPSYDLSMSDQTSFGRQWWAHGVRTSLSYYLGALDDVELEVHAGSAYWRPLEDALFPDGLDTAPSVKVPGRYTAPLMAVDGIGNQLNWYARYKHSLDIFSEVS